MRSPVFLLITLLFLTSCAQSFPLAQSAIPPKDKPVSLQAADVNQCKLAAITYASRPDAQARAFGLGLFLSVVGVAVVRDIERREQRDTFSRCMETNGWRVARVAE